MENKHQSSLIPGRLMSAWGMLHKLPLLRGALSLIYHCKWGTISGIKRPQDWLVALATISPNPDEQAQLSPAVMPPWSWRTAKSAENDWPAPQTCSLQPGKVFLQHSENKYVTWQLLEIIVKYISRQKKVFCVLYQCLVWLLWWLRDVKSSVNIKVT